MELPGTRVLHRFDEPGEPFDFGIKPTEVLFLFGQLQPEFGLFDMEFALLLGQGAAVGPELFFEPFDVAEIVRSLLAEGLALAVQPVVRVGHLHVLEALPGELAAGGRVGLGGGHRLTPEPIDDPCNHIRVEPLAMALDDRRLETQEILTLVRLGAQDVVSRTAKVTVLGGDLGLVVERCQSRQANEKLSPIE